MVELLGILDGEGAGKDLVLETELAVRRSTAPHFVNA
jgi:hypothetical protein